MKILGDNEQLLATTSDMLFNNNKVLKTGIQQLSLCHSNKCGNLESSQTDCDEEIFRLTKIKELYLRNDTQDFSKPSWLDSITLNRISSLEESHEKAIAASLKNQAFKVKKDCLVVTYPHFDQVFDDTLIGSTRF